MVSVFVVGCQINQGWTLNAAEKEYKWWLFMVIWRVQSGSARSQSSVSVFGVSVVSQRLLVSLCWGFSLQGCTPNWSVIIDTECTWAWVPCVCVSHSSWSSLCNLLSTFSLSFTLMTNFPWNTLNYSADSSLLFLRNNKKHDVTSVSGWSQACCHMTEMKTCACAVAAACSMKP